LHLGGAAGRLAGGVREPSRSGVLAAAARRAPDLGPDDRGVQPAGDRRARAVITEPSGRFACVACGTIPVEQPPFRCPRAGEGDLDHLLARGPTEGAAFPRGDETDPFIRYRTLLAPYRLAIAGGMSD